MKKLPAQLPSPKNPADLTRFPARYDASQYNPAKGISNQLAAVSVGIIDGELRLDLDYIDDSRAEVDMNVAYTAAGEFVEIQGSAENGGAFDRKKLDGLLDLAVSGCQKLMEIQNQALSS